MTFPEDHVRGGERVEDHSPASIAIVSIAMIVAALVGLTIIVA